MYIRLIKNIYKESMAKIQTERKGVPFKIKKEARQGDSFHQNYSRLC